MKKNLLLKLQKSQLIIGYFYCIVSLSILLTLITVSCTKNETILQEKLSVKNDIVLRDGRLVFKDSITYLNHIKWIHDNQNNPWLIIDKNNLMGFKSMTEYYLEGMKMEENDPRFVEYVNKYPNVFYKIPFDNSTLYELPHSIVVCYCANKDGLYQIGEKIMRIDWGYLYIINNGDESKINLLLSERDKINDKNISIIPTFSTAKDNNYGYMPHYFSDTKYRIVAKLWEYTISPSWWDDAETIAQKKTLGVWYRANLNTKTARNNGYYEGLSGGLVFPIYPLSQEDNYSTRINIVFSDQQTDMTKSYCPVYHRGRYDNQYIYVYWSDALESVPWASFPSSDPF